MPRIDPEGAEVMGPAPQRPPAAEAAAAVPPPSCSPADGASPAIEQPRVYQLELLELAKKRNVVAFLDTGAGKTFVSALLIRHCLAQERAAAAAVPGAATAASQPALDPAEGCGAEEAHQPSSTHRVAVFLAPKVALVLQQAEVLRAHLGADRVAHFVGEMGLDLHERDRWHAAFRDHDVVAMTPQILLNLLRHGIIKMSQLLLLVFDECHHAKARHPYNRIMKLFYHSQEALLAPRPRIFGMTAAPANMRRGEAQSHLEARIRELEATLDARVVTVVNRASVEEVAQPPKLRVASYAASCWEVGPVAGLQRRLARARTRLQCAGEHFELEWLRSLQRQLGSDGMAPSAQRIFFDPLVPGFTAAKLDQLLFGVEHVLQTLGPYCAALCATEVFASLANPRGTIGLGACVAGLGANGGAGGPDGSDGEVADAGDEQAAEREGGRQRRGSKPAAMRLSEEEAARREADLVEQVMMSGFEVAEVLSEQVAANHAVLDVLEGFAALLGAEHMPCIPPAGGAQQAACEQADQLAMGWGDLLADVRGRVAAGQLLGAQPALAMQALLSGVSPEQLQGDLEGQLPAQQAGTAASPAEMAEAAAAADVEAAAGCSSEDASMAAAQDRPWAPALAAGAFGRSATPHHCLVSPKLAALVAQLVRYRSTAAAAPPGTPGWCGIVFVTQRMAAWALHKFFSSLPATLGVFRTSALMGLGHRLGDGGFGFQEQSRILRRFRAGDLNLLVSTSVAEEGIDVKSCQLVVRFDLPTTAQSYIQSRGRARMHNSELLMMVQEGVEEERQMVGHMVEYEQQLREEVLLNIERLQEGAEDGDGFEAVEEMQLEPDGDATYEVEATGAQATLENAQLLLNSYVCRLPSDQFTSLRPLYRTEQTGPSTFRTRAFLPNNSPLPWADGELQPTRRLAIAAAALQACKQLHQLGALNDYLLPAELDEARRAARPPRPAKERQPQLVTGRKRLAEPDELLCNKAHEPLPLVVIQSEGLRLLAGSLRSLLAQQRPALHCYRWQVSCGGGQDAASDPELQQLLASLALLGLMLPEELPGDLPAFALAWPAPSPNPGQPAAAEQPAIPENGPSADAEASSEPAVKAGGPPAVDGDRLEVRLVPAGSVQLSQEQLRLLLACGSALLAQMLSRGGYRGAAEGLISKVPRPAAAPASTGQGAAEGTGNAGDAEPGLAASSAPQGKAADTCQPGGPVPQHAGPVDQDMPAAEVQHTLPGNSPESAPVPPQAAAPTGPADASATGAPGGLQTPEHEEAAEAAARLAHRAFHRVLLQHDGRGLPRRNRQRLGGRAGRLAAGGPDAAADAGFLLVPLLAEHGAAEGQAGQAGAPAVDWGTVRDVAELAAYEGNVLDRLRRQEEGRGQQQPEAEGAARHEGPALETPAALGARVQRALAGRVVIACHNNTAYLCRGVAEGLTVHSTFEWSKPEVPAAKRSRREVQAAGAAAPAGEQAGVEAKPSDPVAGPGARAPDPAGNRAGQPAQHTSAAGEQGSGTETLSPAAEASAAAADAPPDVVSYAEYYERRWGVSGIDAGQPLLQAARVSCRQLARGLDVLGSRKRSAALHLEPEDQVHLLPQLCVTHPVPVALWRPLGTLPALMWQLEGAMLAAQLLQRLKPDGLPPDKVPSLELLQAAVTARSALEGNDYERLETLGDAFMKFAVSTQLFVTHRQYHEGQLTKRKELVVANVHLAEAAIKFGLDRCLRVLPRNMKNWASPEAVKKSGKVLADAVEALLGAFLVAGGPPAALALMLHLGLLTDWKPISADACIQPESTEAESDVAAIESALGYSFKSRWLVDEALTHCSWPGSGVQCFQRLEFLGDAVLDALVTSHFYTAFSGASPSQMHDMRSAAVNATRLALGGKHAAVKHGIHTHVRHQSPRLFTLITDFIGEWQDRLQEALRAEQADASDPAAYAAVEAALLARCSFGLRGTQTPKVLSDVVESLLGAVYVDSGGDLDVTWRVAQKLLAPMVTPETLPVQPIRRLQELVQQFGLTPKYEEVAREGSGSGRVHVQVSAQGVVLGESVMVATNFKAGCRLAAEAAVEGWAANEARVRSAREAAAAAAAQDVPAA